MLPFNEDQPGPKGPARARDLSEYETFKLFWGDEVFQYILEQTNLYAEQNGEEGQVSSRKELEQRIAPKQLEGLVLRQIWISSSSPWAWLVFIERQQVRDPSSRTSSHPHGLISPVPVKIF